MKIQREKGYNNFEITGLTEGKLLAIKHVFQVLDEIGRLTSVQRDVYEAIKQFQYAEEKANVS